MYFGSVKFFKHLIIIVIVLLVVALISFVVILSIQLSGEQESNRRQGSENNVSGQSGDSGQSQAPYVTEPPVTEPPATDPSEPWPPEPTGDFAHLFPDLYAERCSLNIEHVDDTNYIYLTFDDGPNYFTGSILDHLRDFDVKATFFVIPRQSTMAVSALQRIHNEGHAIGVHSYSHVYSEIYASVEAFLYDFNKARELIYEQTGVRSDIFRFPGGSLNDHNAQDRDDIFAEMERRGFVYFDWNVDSGDTSGATFDSMLRDIPNYVAANTANGRRSIILFHDAGSHTSWVIDDLIAVLQNDPVGYNFGILSTYVQPMQW